MKQNITEEQYFKLSVNARNKLDKWYVDHYFEPGRIYTDVFPYVSIGHMIEFLDEHVKDLAVCRDREWWIGTMLNGITGEVKSFNDCGKIPEYKNMELCDALWLAVTQILEEE